MNQLFISILSLIFNTFPDAVLSTCATATETDVDNAIKVWLKHAPKRLAAQKRRLTV